METFHFHTALYTQVVITAGIAEISTVRTCTAVTAETYITFWFGTFAAVRAQPAVGITAVCTVHTVHFASAVKFKTAITFRTMISVTAVIAQVAVGTYLGTAFAHAALCAVCTAVSLAVAADRAWCHLISAVFFVTFHTGISAAVWTEFFAVSAGTA